MRHKFKAVARYAALIGCTFTLCSQQNAHAQKIGLPASENIAYLSGNRPEFPLKVNTAIKLINSNQFSDAADSIGQLCQSAPKSSIGYQLRGILNLWIGDSKHAKEDFSKAIDLTPDEAVSHLGLALCAMNSSGYDIKTELNRIESCPQLDSQWKNDVSLLQAYVDFCNRDYNLTASLTDAGLASDDLMQKELAVVYMAHSNPKNGISLVKDFLKTSNGVPKVIEDNGLRMAFMQSPHMLFPSVNESALRNMYMARVAQYKAHPIIQNTSTNAKVWGYVDLYPTIPQQQLAAVTSVVFYIDDKVVSTLQSRPYIYKWNTNNLLNGPHTIKIEAMTEDNGVLHREVYPVVVANDDFMLAGSTRANMSNDDYQAIECALWKMLRPRPSRAVVELILARDRMRAGNKGDAATHLLIATALDPNLTDMQDKSIRSLLKKGRSYRVQKDVGVWSCKTTKKYVALTFDDGPNPAKTPALLDALDSVKAKATFFIVGTRAETAPDLVRRMAAAGHEIENHSYSHPNIAQCLPDTVESEILRTNVIIRTLCGHNPRYFRPPGGNANDTLSRLADKYDMALAFWSLDALKAEEEASPNGIVNYVMKKVKPGSIILLHNAPDVTSAAVPKLVQALRAQGYEIVTLRKLFEAGDKVKPTGKPVNISKK